MFRCEVTGNPVGTDTWKVGSPCQCKECSAYLKRARTEVRRQVIDGEITNHTEAAFRLTFAKPKLFR